MQVRNFGCYKLDTRPYQKIILPLTLLFLVKIWDSYKRNSIHFALSQYSCVQHMNPNLSRSILIFWNAVFRYLSKLCVDLSINFQTEVLIDPLCFHIFCSTIMMWIFFEKINKFRIHSVICMAINGHMSLLQISQNTPLVIQST